MGDKLGGRRSCSGEENGGKVEAARKGPEIRNVALLWRVAVTTDSGKAAGLSLLGTGDSHLALSRPLPDGCSWPSGSRQGGRDVPVWMGGGDGG